MTFARSRIPKTNLKCTKINWNENSVKILENVVYDGLYNVLNNNMLLSPCKFGFRKKFPFHNNDTLITSMSKNLHVIGISLNLSNAYKS